MNQQLLNKVLDCPKVPSLPAVAMEVIDLTNNDNVSMRDLAGTIELDQGLSSKILKTVNSAFYGLSKPCGTISRAQLMLGLNGVKTLALGFSLVSSIKEDSDGFDFQSYWRRGVYTGVASKMIASHVKCGEPEEAFLGGLMQDIGMIAMYQALGEQYVHVLDHAGEVHGELVSREREAFELQHPVVGAMLAERWKLPASLVTPIKYHERPTAAPKEHQQVVRCVGLGNLAAAAMTYEDAAPWLSQFYGKAKQWFGISQHDAESLLAGIVEGGKEIARLFGRDIGADPCVEDLLETANDRLVGMLLDQERETDKATRQSEDLQRAIRTDELTGLASRKHFYDTVKESFERARTVGEPLSVVILDADSFREVNDQYGRVVGDKVLQRLAKKIEENCGVVRAVLARHGGEDFAAILPRVAKASAGEFAEHCRRDIAERPFTIRIEGAEAIAVRLTVSVGVASLDDASAHAFQRPEQLVNAADQAVRAAKAAGGDCVRVFAPKTQQNGARAAA